MCPQSFLQKIHTDAEANSPRLEGRGSIGPPRAQCTEQCAIDSRVQGRVQNVVSEGQRSSTPPRSVERLLVGARWCWLTVSPAAACRTASSMSDCYSGMQSSLFSLARLR